MKAFIIFCNLVLLSTAYKLDLQSVNDVDVSASAESSEEFDFDSLPEYLKDEVNCLKAEYEKPEFNARIEAKALEFMEFWENNKELIDGLDEVTDNFDTKGFQKVCWEAKGLTSSVLVEVRSAVKICIKKDEEVVNFLLNFIEKFFEFTCELTKEDFQSFDNFDNITECLGTKVEQLMKIQELADSDKIDENLCYWNYKETIPYVKNIVASCVQPGSVIVKFIDFLNEFFVNQCKPYEIAANIV